jgi:hypothetical protein
MVKESRGSTDNEEMEKIKKCCSCKKHHTHNNYRRDFSRNKILHKDNIMNFNRLMTKPRKRKIQIGEIFCDDCDRVFDRKSKAEKRALDKKLDLEIDKNNNPPQKTWLNTDFFLRSFYRYLIAMSDKIDDPTSMFKSNLLCREDILDLIQKQCFLIDDLKKQYDDLQIPQAEFQEKMDIILKDELLNQVYEMGTYTDYIAPTLDNMEITWHN